jgi:Bacterial pre-peptidase C-terminal domain
MKKMGLILLIFAVFATPLLAETRTAIFPRFASGNGWTSEFFFANQGIATVSGIAVSFYDENGSDLSVVTNLGTSNTFTFNLAAGATQPIRITSGTTFLQGYVLVVYPDFSSPVRGSQIYRYEQNGTVQVEVGVPQQEEWDHFSFPVEYDSSQHIYPAIALTNPMTVDQTLVVNLFNSDGTIANTATVPLTAGHIFVGFLDADSLFPGLKNSTFTGTVSVSSPFGAGVLTLRQDNDAFGAVATDGGPILAPFVVTSAYSTDADSSGGSNDYDAEAQVVSLPVQINGSIGYAGDWDIYTFSGKAGKILTAICDTTQLTSTSNADCVLHVYQLSGSTYNEIAYNDQNGSAPGGYPQNDAFIQVVLPNTGTYYVAVYNYDDTVGDSSTYKYNLHLKVR